MILLSLVMLVTLSGNNVLAEEMDSEGSAIISEDVDDGYETMESNFDDVIVEDVLDMADDEQTEVETETVTTEGMEIESQSDDGIMVSSIEDVTSDAQAIATTTVTELQVNTTYSLSDVIGTTQYFSVSSAGRVQFIIENSTSTSFKLYLYGTGLVSEKNGISMLEGIEEATSCYLSLPEAAQYSFLISGNTPNSEATLYIKYEAAGTYNGEVEINDSFDSANDISLNTEYIGGVSGYDYYDYYRFTLANPSKVSLDFDFYDQDGNCNSFYVYLYSEDSNGNTSCIYFDSIYFDELDYQNGWRLPAGNYYCVIGNGEYAGYASYLLTVTATEESKDAYEIENNNLTSQANSKQTNTWYTGNISHHSTRNQDYGFDDIDWFSYTITEKCYLTIEMKTPRQTSGTVTATLYKKSGTELTEIATITNGSNPYTTSETIFCQTGTYYLKMTGDDSDWDYSVCLTQDKYTALTAITLPSTKTIAAGSSATLSASFTPSNASEQGLTWTSSNTSVATVDQNGKVTAVASGKVTITATSSFSDTSSIKASCTVYVTKKVTLAISSATNTSSGIKLTWKKVSGASGYYVYRKTKSGSYSSTPLATITSGSTVSYTDTSVKNKNGTTYIYKVVPYSDLIVGSGTGKTIVRLKGVSLSSVKNTSSRKLTVKWKKTTSVTGYQIQYSKSKTFSSGNKTVKVSGAKKVSKAISKLTKGKTYYVRIRTYKTVSGKTYYSAWSSKKKVKITK